MRPKSKQVERFILLALGGLVAASFILEYVFKMQPCSLCLLERYLLVGSLLLLGATKLFKRHKTFFTFTTIITASVGIALSLRHIYIQWLPNNTIECGAGLRTLMEMYPMWQAVLTTIVEAGDCMHPDYFLYIPMTYWSLASFISLFVMGLYHRLSRGRT